MSSSFAVPLRSDLRVASPKQVSLIVIGTGHVGSALLEQLWSLRDKVARGIRVHAIANSRRFIRDAHGVSLGQWEALLEESPVPATRSRLIDAVREAGNSTTAIVDCTASNEIVDDYETFVAAGAHVVTPNKKANVLPWPRYERLNQTFKRHDRKFLFRTNVGAGLPVLSTLNELLSSGDTINRIEGILSGTLSYLFNRYDGSTPFEAIVREAHRMGLTEPDPLTDLSGQDVAAKLLVLARQLGWSLNLEDIQVENLADKDIPSLFRSAARNNCVLRYVATLCNGKASARLRSVAVSDPLAVTRHTDNLIAFHTERYSVSPLVIQGPGAGPGVTAAGVLADIMKV